MEVVFVGAEVSSAATVFEVADCDCHFRDSEPLVGIGPEFVRRDDGLVDGACVIQNEDSFIYKSIGLLALISTF